jgi:hypothetical protein
MSEMLTVQDLSATVCEAPKILSSPLNHEAPSFRGLSPAVHPPTRRRRGCVACGREPLYHSAWTSVNQRKTNIRQLPDTCRDRALPLFSSRAVASTPLVQKFRVCWKSHSPITALCALLRPPLPGQTEDCYAVLYFMDQTIPETQIQPSLCGPLEDGWFLSPPAFESGTCPVPPANYS